MIGNLLREGYRAEAHKLVDWALIVDDQRPVLTNDTRPPAAAVLPATCELALPFRTAADQRDNIARMAASVPGPDECPPVKWVTPEPGEVGSREWIEAREPGPDECDNCLARAELYYDEESGLAFCDRCH